MKLFLPGDCLATAEEFASGLNTFEENGEIIADSAGHSSEDTKHRIISIQKPKQIIKPEKGTIVLGIVNFVRTSSVSIELLPLRKKNSRQAIGASFAMLPVRNVAFGFVRDLKREFKTGDIVMAKIAEVKPWGIDLRTNEHDLGVIKAFCSKCRHSLLLFGHSLKCTNCGNSEERKLSAEYGKTTIID